MDDMNSFERLIAGEVVSEMGPSRSVDASAVFAAAVPAQSHKWRFGSMFSATKFVIAGAIVALFGGFVLAGALTQPNEEGVPAAATGSPMPTTTETLLSSMTTEEVEPGVFRVIDDGRRQLAASVEFGSAGYPIAGPDLVAGLDGSVWWFGPDTFFRLGGEQTHVLPWSATAWPTGSGDLEVALDGTLWSHNPAAPGPELASFDGRSWTARDDELPDGLTLGRGSVEVRPDGTVWVFTELGAAARLTADGWERVPELSLYLFPGGLRQGARLMHLAVTEATNHEDSSIEDDRIERRIYRLDDSAWREHATPGDFFDGESGPDGRLWVTGGVSNSARLALFDGEGWRTFETGPTAYHDGPRTLEVAPDGSVWFRPASGDEDFYACEGIANFDGQSLGRHLRGLCIFTADVAPDGHVWVVAGPTTELMHAYVITPEAAVASEAVAVDPPEEVAPDTTATLDLLPGVDLVTEEVEPGVYRVLGDGVRDLSRPLVTDGYDAIHALLDSDVAAGRDGSVWLFWPDESFRLGDPATTGWDSTGWEDDFSRDGWDVEIGPDGGVLGPGRQGVALDPGGEWTDIGREIDAFAVGPDGVVWAIGPPLAGCPPPQSERDCDTVVMTLDVPSGGLERVARLKGWEAHDIWVTPDGEVWLYNGWKGLARMVGSDTEGLGGPRSQHAADVMSQDGTLWIGGSDTRLHRYDGVAWTAYEHSDIGITRAGLFDSNPFSLAAGADGSVWIAYGCGQVTHFDGTTATNLLEGLCVFDMAGAPDGSVWLQAAPRPAPDGSRWAPDSLHTYVITPKAVAAAE